MNTPNKTKPIEFMLDTVVLKVKYPDFKVRQPNLFTPAFIIQDKQANFTYQYGHNAFKVFKQNPTLQNKQDEDYRPRLTGYLRFDDYQPSYDLHIEFSVPKLLFKQSLQELSDVDFDRAISILKFQLQKMGVEVSDQAIRSSTISRAHFGKNIPLPSPITAQDALEELYKADIGRGKHINMRHFENGGQALYFYASSCSMIFYDKLRDIATPRNKAVDKDKFKQEKLLVASSDKQQELLRFEVRFAKQQSLDAVLSGVLGRKVKGITFKEIFNRDLCRKVILKSWHEIINSPASQLALKMDMPLEDIFDSIISSHIVLGKKKAHSLNKVLQDFALYVLINKCGVRKVRNRIGKNWSSKSWTRLYGKVRKTAHNLKTLPTAHTVSEIQSALDSFEVYDWRPG